MEQPKSKEPTLRRKPRKGRFQQSTDEALSITSLTDILTVLLIFLLKNYSSSPAQIKPAKDLKPPSSTSILAPDESTAITITMQNILVDDEPVMKINNGFIPSSAKRSDDDFIISELHGKLQEEVAHQKKVAQFNKTAAFKGITTIIADRQIPFSSIARILYTAGQSEFGTFKFAVVKRSD